MERGRAEVVAVGDAALLVRLGEGIDPATNRRVHALAERVSAAAATDAGAGLGTPVPAYASLLVPFDGLRLSEGDARARLEPLLKGVAVADFAADEPPLEIAVRYGGADGPDLDEVAERTGLSAGQVVELHCSVEYRAYMLGFAPGFAYLGELPAVLELPRRDSPRQRVAAGSVAIAGRQTAVYPLPTPGGWQLIGRTEAPLWDPRRSPPALITPGRRVRFVPA
ncbi:MAG TPA: 5-oxoprolinase subunit PxpB [Candidatus Limnocylindrales bacterium]|jgi:KipI family sensor histidine kinase inhibitor